MTFADFDTALDIELEPLGQEPVKGPGEDQAAVDTVLGRRNVVRLGAPRWSDHVAGLLAQSPTLPEDIAQGVRAGHDFWRIRPSLSLLPDRDCVFVSAELSIELGVTSPSGTGTALPLPLVHSLEPEEVVDQLPYTRSRKTSGEVSGEAAAGIAKLLAKVTTENSEERSGTRRIRRVYGYGRNFSEVGWRLTATTEHQLAGDVADLSFVVGTAAGSRLHGRFRIVAEIAVQTAPDRWLTWLFAPRATNPVLEATYPLSG